MTAPDFASLGLSEPILRALAQKNYTTPTPIQARSIPHLLQGRDLLGIAQTGTGKTAAFALPMLQLLTAANRRPQPRNARALVLAPTRELATQIADSFLAYGRYLHQTVTIVFGGVGQNPQVKALARGVDILVATPGRLLDLIQQRHCSLANVEILVLDEADRMLDMGFLPDVKRILATLPAQRQSLLFSATMPQDITQLSQRYLRDPLRVEVTPPAATADRIEQSVYMTTKARKRDLLVSLLQDPQFVRTLVFSRTKHGADRIAKSLQQAGIDAHAIHGNKSQNARERALDAFRDGKSHVLVATDIAARGIDVPDITHVINFDLPNIPESYVHRIGRTARAGRDGIAISFCDEGEREYLRDIEKLIRKRIPVVGGGPRQQTGQPLPQPRATAPAAAPAPAKVPAHAADNPWFGEGIADDAEAERQPVPVHADDDREAQQPRREPSPHRPQQRPAPGPYVPQPRPKPAPPRPRHERQQHHRGQRGPAMPNAIDPEQRRQPPQPQRHGGQGGHGGHGNRGGHGGRPGHGGPRGHGGQGGHGQHGGHGGPSRRPRR
ncbi:MAG: DEAD/DEAH box helicase [Planctomycetes bacterium]|nr:DEAD/DEAH box helicase [Planctomycetota bacterium]